jgi:hypothetical protein
MSKSSKAKARKPWIVSEFSTKFASPQTIFESIEDASTGLPDADPYRTRIEDIMGLLLDPQGRQGVDASSDAGHIRHTAGGHALEEAARETGFILGFEYCRDLLLAKIMQKAGAR